MGDKGPGDKKGDKKRKQGQEQDPDFDNPETEFDLITLISSRKLKGTTIHTMTEMRSASKIIPDQFLMLRTICPGPVDRKWFVGRLTNYGITQQQWDRATDIISRSAEFNSLITLISNDTPIESISPVGPLAVLPAAPSFASPFATSSATPFAPPAAPTVASPAATPCPGRFMIVKLWQEKVFITRSKNRTELSSPAQASTSTEKAGKTKEKPRTGLGTFRRGGTSADEGPSTSQDDRDETEPTEDETIVVAFLGALLDTVTSLVDKSNDRPSWSLRHIRFEAKFKNEKKFVAITDGCLRDDDLNVKALIEVKPAMHARDGSTARPKESVVRQETAQLAGWIKNHERSLGIFMNRRLLISAYKTEIYLKFAHYDKAYVNYLTGNQQQQQQQPGSPFMEIRTFGPWLIDNPRHMHELGCVIVAIALHVKEHTQAQQQPPLQQQQPAYQHPLQSLFLP